MARVFIEVLCDIIACAQGTPTKEISKRREGEVWELQESGENAGKYILKSCYKGSLLVNATLDTQVRLSAAVSAMEEEEVVVAGESQLTQRRELYPVNC